MLEDKPMEGLGTGGLTSARQLIDGTSNEIFSFQVGTVGIETVPIYLSEPVDKAAEERKRLREELENRLDIKDAYDALVEARKKGTIPWEKVKADLGTYMLT